MWNDDRMFTDTKGTDKIQVFSDKFGFPSIPIPDECSIEIKDIIKNNVDFSTAASSDEEAYNPIDIKLSLSGAYTVELVKKSKICGQIISIPNSIFLKGHGKETSILSTHLLIDSKYRNKRFAEALILTTVKESFDRKILIGYHWIKQSKTKSAIKSYCWFRPLDLGKCLKADYELLKMTSYVLPIEENGISVSKSIALDFEKIKSSTEIRLLLSEEELVKISNVITFLTVKLNDQIIGIVGYRKFIIIKPKLNITVTAAQICYFDSSSHRGITVLTRIMHILKNDGYVAVHGVFMSSIGETINELKLSITAEIYIDFCNVAQPEFKINDIALLYI